MQNKHSVAQLVEDTRSSLQKGEIAEALALARRAIAVDVEHPPAVFLTGVILI